MRSGGYEAAILPPCTTTNKCALQHGLGHILLPICTDPLAVTKAKSCPNCSNVPFCLHAGQRRDNTVAPTGEGGLFMSNWILSQYTRLHSVLSGQYVVYRPAPPPLARTWLEAFCVQRVCNAIIP
jgi:hypothetical protein